jgi:hypothetical protein
MTQRVSNLRWQRVCEGATGKELSVRSQHAHTHPEKKGVTQAMQAACS